MNIIITGTGFSFPDGTGAAARVASFAKGLMHHGAAVHLFLPKPTENEATGERNEDLRGVYEGIPFEYTCGRRLVAKTRVGAMLLYLRGLWRTCRAILRIHRRERVDAILLWYGESPINMLVFKTLAILLGALLIVEECEFPFAARRKTAAVRATMWFNDHIGYRMPDGVFVISTCLQDFFATRLRKTAGVLRVPILVETDTFAHPIDAPDRTERRVIYCGNLNHEGEIAELLQAFSEVAGDLPSWSVQIIGDLAEGQRRTELITLIAQLGLNGRVQLLGERPRKEIPGLLAGGDVMVLPRAARIFSLAGFPTKLGEYLASGKPVVVTGTGDIPLYLQDGASAFVTPPGDSAAFARALRYVMTHPREAAEVGRRGREVALRQFDTLVNCGRVVEFIETLKTVRET